MTKSTIGRVLAVVAVATVAVLGGVTSSQAAPINPSGSGAARQATTIPNTQGAVTGWHIQDGSVYCSDLGSTMCEWFTAPPAYLSVGTPQVKAGAITKDKLSASVQAELAAGGPKGDKGDTGAKGDQGDPASDVKGTIVLDKTCAATTIVNIGGSFATGKTKVCEFTLPAGKLKMDVSGFFARTAAGPAGTRPELALRVADGSTWGADYGTIFPGEISPTAGRELTGSTFKVLNVSGPVTVEVFAFGYNDDQGTAGSGQIQVSVDVAATRG
jgi:hypothetical protein